MQRLVTVVGSSGVGKTSLVRALEKTGKFVTSYEQHAERPFQELFRNDPHYALANQMDYLLWCAEQERVLRSGPRIGLMDGGLDPDYYGFTRLFLRRGLLTQHEHDLCRRLYERLRESQPGPDLIIRLRADLETVKRRLASRNRVNIATAEDTALFDALLDEWLASVPSKRVLNLDVSTETLQYQSSVKRIMEHLNR